MDEQQPPGDKPFDPTPRRLEEARRKGETVRSADLNTAIIYGGFLLGGVLVPVWAVETLGTLFMHLWGEAHSLAPQILSGAGLPVAASVIQGPFTVLAALFVFPAGFLLASLFAQRAIIFSPNKLQPKLSRIGIIQNAKQKFGSQGLFAFSKSAAKLAIVSAMLGLYLAARIETILVSLYADPGQMMTLLGGLIFEFMVMVTVLAVFMGAIDWLWEYAQHQKKNRMSRQEIVDETKSSEGDPHIKQQRRQRAQSIAMNQMLRDVGRADVVVVNPTHFAVALSWDRSGGQVPVCVAKGVDETARAIREAASEAAVPIYSDPPTARILHATIEIGEPIHETQFEVVAAAIRFADTMRAKAKQRRF